MRRILWGTAALGLLGGVAVLAMHRAPRTAPVAGEGVVDNWCADGLELVAGGGCLAVPAARPPVPLVIYLHGMYDRSAAGEELDRQRRVAAKATARGYAVLALRSNLGVCHPDNPEYATRFCWPSNEQVADRADAFVNAWAEPLREARRRTGSGPTYILGFSSGAFFTALLAVRDLFPADAFAIAHGGPVEPVRAPPTKRPLLLLSADDDISQDWMLRLDDELTGVRWPHESYAREGGHALTDDDIDAALTFFTRARVEGLPLRPPLGTHRPKGRDRDAVAKANPAERDSDGEAASTDPSTSPPTDLQETAPPAP